MVQHSTAAPTTHCPRKDATLGELTTLLSRELAKDRPDVQLKYSYRLIYGDNNRDRYLVRDLGTVSPTHKSPEWDKSLGESRFVIGDW